MGARATCACGVCPKCKHREYMNAYYRRPGRADKARGWARRYREMNIVAVRDYDRERGFHEHDPQKVYARNATRALRRKEPHDCERCSASNAHAHHDDYSRPLDVRWLCRSCHALEHRKVP